MPIPAAEGADPCDVTGAALTLPPSSQPVGERIINSSERMAQSKIGTEQQPNSVLSSWFPKASLWDQMRQTWASGSQGNIGLLQLNERSGQSGTVPHCRTPGSCSTRTSG